MMKNLHKQVNWRYNDVFQMYLLFSPSKELAHGNSIFHLKTRKEENYLATKFLTQLNVIEYIVSDYCQVSESGLFRETHGVHDHVGSVKKNFLKSTHHTV